MIRLRLIIAALLILCGISLWLVQPWRSKSDIKPEDDQQVIQQFSKFLETIPPEELAKLAQLRVHPSAKSMTHASSPVPLSREDEERRVHALKKAGNISESAKLLADFLIDDKNAKPEPGPETLETIKQLLNEMPAKDLVFADDRSKLLELAYHQAKAMEAKDQVATKQVFKETLENGVPEPMTPGVARPTLQSLVYFLDLEKDGNARQAAIDAVKAQQTDPETKHFLDNLSTSNQAYMQDQKRPAGYNNEKR
jgi:hypothetical protein